MRYFLFFVCSFCLCTLLQAQEEHFREIDRYVQKAPRTLHQDISGLTEYLIKPASNELEKVRAIYSWITHNIDYDVAAYKNGNKRINKTNKDILNRRKAVCFGYSTLFRDMCQRANIKVALVSGYSKGTLTAQPKLERPDHAWNAVFIDQKWYLLDATWGSSLLDKTNDFVQTYKEGYFLTSPELFIINHLPADPMWQLLDCPVPAQLFLEPADSMLRNTQSTQDCFSFQDSIRHFFALDRQQQRLKEAQNTHSYHTTPDNQKALGHAFMDMAGILSDRAEQFQKAEQFEAMVEVQDSVIRYCRKARAFADLYHWQNELFINTLINQATAKSKLADQLTEKVAILEEYDQIIALLKESQALLDALPDSPFKSYAKEATDGYIEVAEYNLNFYKNRN